MRPNDSYTHPSRPVQVTWCSDLPHLPSRCKDIFFPSSNLLAAILYLEWMFGPCGVVHGVFTVQNKHAGGRSFQVQYRDLEDKAMYTKKVVLASQEVYSWEGVPLLNLVRSCSAQVGTADSFLRVASNMHEGCEGLEAKRAGVKARLVEVENQFSFED
ncbi:hypothetical protein BGZ82_008572 [Podila clonocystis]|nr:hypothetical protein BGZ82_008572 [Podila clonocystis]